MNSLGETPAQWRGSFDDASAWYVALAAAAQPSLDRPGLGEWSVRDLLGHTGRALTTAAAYLGGSGPIEQETAADYYRASVAVDPATIAARGREAGEALGEDPVAAISRLAGQAREALAAAPDDSLVTSRLGVMTLAEYLPTRTFELVVHGCDVAAALDLPLDVPATAAASSLRLAAALVDRGAAGEVLLALTGRRPLPTGFSLFG